MKIRKLFAPEEDEWVRITEAIEQKEYGDYVSRCKRAFEEYGGDTGERWRLETDGLKRSVGCVFVSENTLLYCAESPYGAPCGAYF